MKLISVCLNSLSNAQAMTTNKTPRNYNERILLSVIKLDATKRGIANIAKGYKKHSDEVLQWLPNAQLIAEPVLSNSITVEELLEQLGITYKTLDKLAELVDAVYKDTQKMTGSDTKITQRIFSNSMKFEEIMTFIIKHKPERCEAQSLKGEAVVKMITEDYNTLKTRLKVARANATKLKKLLKKMKR